MIEHLLWDTNFFGIKTGRIIWREDFNHSIREVMDYCRENSYKLVYIYCNNAYYQSNSIIRQSNAVLYDEKITFHKSINRTKYNPDLNIKPFCSVEIPETLYSLGIQSGEYSRFKTDKNFEQGKFEELYKKWVENSVNKSIVDEVFVYWFQNKIAGFNTVKCQPKEGVIGLIAVDNKFRGQAIGTKLVLYTENYLMDNGIDYLTVVTQLANAGAVNFYKRNNFSIKEITNIYHLWII